MRVSFLEQKSLLFIPPLACTLQNIGFIMPPSAPKTEHRGILMENGSGDNEFLLSFAIKHIDD